GHGAEPLLPPAEERGSAEGGHAEGPGQGRGGDHLERHLRLDVPEQDDDPSRRGRAEGHDDDDGDEAAEDADGPPRLSTCRCLRWCHRVCPLREGLRSAPPVCHRPAHISSVLAPRARPPQPVGSDARTSKPPSDLGPTCRDPPRASTRSRIPLSPNPPPRGFFAAVGEAAAASAGPLITVISRNCPLAVTVTLTGAPAGCRRALDRLSWTMRKAVRLAVGVSSTVSAGSSRSTLAPDPRVMSTSAGMSSMVGCGARSASRPPRRIASRPRISVSACRDDAAIESNSPRLRSSSPGSRYFAVVACTLMTDMLWATTSWSSWAMRLRSSSSGRLASSAAVSWRSVASCRRPLMNRLPVTPMMPAPAAIARTVMTFDRAPATPPACGRISPSTPRTALTDHRTTRWIQV